MSEVRVINGVPHISADSEEVRFVPVDDAQASTEDESKKGSD